MISRKMLLTILIMAMGMVLIIIGCFKFLSINQPESASPGEKIQVYLEVRSDTQFDDENPHYGIFGMRLPLDWKVDSVYFDGDYGTGYATFLHPDSVDAEPGKYDYWADSLEYYFPSVEGMGWIVYQSTKNFKVTKDPEYKYFDVYVDLIAGERGGKYDLGYFITMAAYELADTSWYAVSLENPIEIINLPPDLNLPDSIVFVNNRTAEINLWDITEDESADSSLTYEFSSTIPELLTDFEEQSGILRLSADGYAGTGKLYVEVTDPGGEVGYDTTNIRAIDYTAIESEINLYPTRYELYTNFPNPFNPATALTFDLVKSTVMKLEVFDTMGRLISTLIDDFRPAGKHQITFRAENLSSGVYYYVITTPEFKKSRKMLLVK